MDTKLKTSLGCKENWFQKSTIFFLFDYNNKDYKIFQIYAWLKDFFPKTFGINPNLKAFIKSEVNQKTWQ